MNPAPALDELKVIPEPHPQSPRGVRVYGVGPAGSYWFPDFVEAGRVGNDPLYFNQNQMLAAQAAMRWYAFNG